MSAYQLLIPLQDQLEHNVTLEEMSKEQLIKALETVLNVKCETIYTKNSQGIETLRYQFTIPLDKE